MYTFKSQLVFFRLPSKGKQALQNYRISFHISLKNFFFKMPIIRHSEELVLMLDMKFS